MRRALLAAVVLLVTAGPVLAQGNGFFQGIPLFVRLQGRVGAPSQATLGAQDWTLQVGNGQVRFQLTHMAIMSGNASSANVVDALGPYLPQLMLYGPKSLLEPLSAAKPSDAVSMLGYLTGAPGAAQLMVSSLDVTPPVKSGKPTPPK
jgi:hypothetical protein